MTEKKVYTIVALVAVVALVLSCVVGALAGGITGFLAASRHARAMAPGMMQREWHMVPHGMPWPEFQPEFKEEWPLDEFSWTESGALIEEVVQGTPADQAGLMPGDIIVAIDKIPVDGNHLLPDIIGGYEPGDWVTLTFLREMRKDTVKLRLGEHPEMSGRAYLGIYYTALSGSDWQSPSD